MRKLGRFALVIIFSFIGYTAVYCTHNRAGEIIYEQIGDLTIRATIITYTKTSSQSADRDSLELYWGDGTSEYVVRSNGGGLPLENDVKLNYYIAEHTYPGRATYTLSMTDPNRVANIVNVNAPYSEDVPFYLETSFTFLNSQFEGFNSSPILLQAPIDFACIGKLFIHNPNAYDKDGDSLVYELIIPFQAKDSIVPDYKFPNEIIPGLNNLVSLNTQTGNFIWDAPQMMGEYNIAIRIKEFRNGILINSMIRDMQIFVENCSNNPPVIEVEKEICVIAGEEIEIDILVTDPDPGQLVALTASGGPFEFETNAAELEVIEGYQSPPLIGKLKWKTDCNQISKQAYQIVFRAVDNFFMEQTGLADLKTLKIKVVGPPPENLEAETSTGVVNLSWDAPYACEVTENEYFQGFSVWRKIGSNPFEIDTCDPGLNGKGYIKVNYNTQELSNGSYVFSDENVERGKTYCYRVLAEFAKTSSSGFPYNRVESLPSNEVCVQISRDLPLFTKVSVLSTDQTSGEIEVRWTKPLIMDLDTLENPGPYQYKLQRGEGFNPSNFNDVPGASFSSTFFNENIDTAFTETGINTIDTPQTYRIEFYVNGSSEPYGISSSASSTYLSIISTDQKNILAWDYDTPWENYFYTVYRFNENSNNFDSIGFSDEAQYEDFGLTNGKEYCYKVKTWGTYGLQGLASPILNYSQEICGIPLDTLPPCKPNLSITNICQEANPDADPDDFINFLSWSNPNIACEETDDVVSYNIYYAPTQNADLSWINSNEGAENNTYEDSPDTGLAGCYAISAVDSVGNESLLSSVVCVDNCPVYELPNVFTPNGDNANDLFVPLAYRFIDHIDFKVFNRWGNLVFETSDKQINWDGTNLRGQNLSEGIYYYQCSIYELRVDGIIEIKDFLTGYIHLIRGK
jgi:gliding motility-associated-like protein